MLVFPRPAVKLGEVWLARGGRAFAARAGRVIPGTGKTLSRPPAGDGLAGRHGVDGTQKRSKA